MRRFCVRPSAAAPGGAPGTGTVARKGRPKTARRSVRVPPHPAPESAVAGTRGSTAWCTNRVASRRKACSESQAMSGAVSPQARKAQITTHRRSVRSAGYATGAGRAGVPRPMNELVKRTSAANGPAVHPKTERPLAATNGLISVEFRPPPRASFGYWVTVFWGRVCCLIGKLGTAAGRSG